MLFVFCFSFLLTRANDVIGLWAVKLACKQITIELNYYYKWSK
jgi:hypothetical protein